MVMIFNSELLEIRGRKPIPISWLSAIILLLGRKIKKKLPRLHKTVRGVLLVRPRGKKHVGWIVGNSTCYTRLLINEFPVMFPLAIECFFLYSSVNEIIYLPV